MDFVDEDNLAVEQAELIFGVHEDEAALACHLGAAFEEFQCIILHLSEHILRDYSLRHDFLVRDVLVVTLVGLGGRGEDGVGELFVFTETLGELDAADGARSGGIVAPCAAGQIAAHNHLYLKGFALKAHGDHGVWDGEFPVGDDVGGSVQEVCCHLVEHLPFGGDSFGEDYVEGGDTVRGHHDEEAVINVIDVAHLAVVNRFLSGEIKIGL